MFDALNLIAPVELQPATLQTPVWKKKKWIHITGLNSCTVNGSIPYHEWQIMLIEMNGVQFGRLQSYEWLTKQDDRGAGVRFV